MSEVSRLNSSNLQDQNAQSKVHGSHYEKRVLFRPVVMFLTLSAVLVASLGFSARGIAQNPAPQPPQKLTAAQKAKIPELQKVSANIRRVARILETEGIHVEAGLLFTPNGRKKARVQLDAYPDMYVAKVHNEPLRGVVMANSLTLPEKVNLESDTVIIVKNITFNGRAPIIKGPHDIHLFILDSAKAANGPKTVITIDTSGYGNKEWLESQNELAANSKRNGRTLAHHPAVQNGTAGANGVMGGVGTNGFAGTNGAAGTAGSCSSNKNGGTGSPGIAGSAAGHGGNGSNGANGNAGSSQTITIDNPNAGGFNVLAKGGNGGNGGPGGYGGAGGHGGNGGAGGNGAGCNCLAGGLGTGGNGGAAGAGGAGGNGGKGGNGGNGGSGGTVVINYPFGYDITQISVNSQGGTAGQGGQGGSGQGGGAPGNPGAGGHGGTYFACGAAQSGIAGSGAMGGAGGSGGDSGQPGQPGATVPATWIPSGGPGDSGSAGESQSWEPGATYQSCTAWYLVSFHCEYYINSLVPKGNKVLANHAKPLTILNGYTCYETGRSYMGCF